MSSDVQPHKATVLQSVHARPPGKEREALEEPTRGSRAWARDSEPYSISTVRSLPEGTSAGTGLDLDLWDANTVNLYEPLQSRTLCSAECMHRFDFPVAFNIRGQAF